MTSSHFHKHTVDFHSCLFHYKLQKAKGSCKQQQTHTWVKTTDHNKLCACVSSLSSQTLYLDVIVSIQQDVGRLQVQMEQRWVHAVQEVHSHRSLVDDAKAELPGQRLIGQQGLQWAGLHVLHDQPLGVFTDPVHRQDVSELGCLHLFSFLEQLGTIPVFKEENKNKRSRTTQHCILLRFLNQALSLRVTQQFLTVQKNIHQFTAAFPLIHSSWGFGGGWGCRSWNLFWSYLGDRFFKTKAHTFLDSCLSIKPALP